MHSEYWSWTQEMRDAHLWLTNEGKLLMAWGWCGDAAHLLALRDLEEMVGKTDAVIAVVGPDDAEVYRMWGDPALDVVVISYRGYVGIFGPCQCGVRREYRTPVTVETPGRHWWLTDGDGVTTVALGWRDLLAVLAPEDEEEEEEAEEGI